MPTPAIRRALANAEREARECFPQAVSLKPILYGGRAMVEVYSERNRARVFVPECER